MRRMGKGRVSYSSGPQLPICVSHHPSRVSGVRRHRQAQAQGESPMALIAAALIFAATLSWAIIMMIAAKRSDSPVWAEDTTIGALWVMFMGTVIAMGVSAAHWL